MAHKLTHEAGCGVKASEPCTCNAICSGSNKSPAEMVILDTVPGMNPWGHCTVCGKHMMLVNLYKIPEH